MIDSVLGSNAVDGAVEARRRGAGRADHISIRLRPGDGERLRLRAQARGMNFTTYAAALIRAHLRANPPMPLEELATVERSLGEVSAIARSLSQIARREGRGINSSLQQEFAPALQAVERMRQNLRDLVKANVISWESTDAEAAP